MRCSFQHLALIGLVATGIVSAGIVSVSVEKRLSAQGSSPSLVRRDGSLDLDALNNITGGGYYAEFGVGTPPQTLSFLLDTGSSDTWVNSWQASSCKSGGCMKQFNPGNSSTFYKIRNANFSIDYLDNRHTTGDYFNDTVTIDGAKIRNQQLGLALQSGLATGIMGLGFSSLVAADTEYRTVVDNMVSEKLIPKAAFSLYLNDLSSSKGTILFGGVDTDKFHGGLATLPLQPQPLYETQEIISYSVELKGFKVSGVNTPSISAAAVLDSGSTVTILPDAVAQPVFEHFGVVHMKGLFQSFVDCAKADSKDVTFAFQFQGKTIQVPLDDMIINNLGIAQDKLMKDPVLASYFKGWKGVCMFGISSAADVGVSSSQFALLGDTFLRSAYVVYDMENKQVGIAQATLNATSSTILEFEAGSKTIPGPVATGDEDSEKSAGAALDPSWIVVVTSTLFMAVAVVMSAL